MPCCREYRGGPPAIGKQAGGKIIQMGAWFHWASLGIGAGGLIASIVGLIFAFLARRAAKSAEDAATLAENAANSARIEAQRALNRNLSSVDIERAVALINRLKELHREGNWGAALWLYQDLRRTLSEIRASMPTDLDQFRNAINEAVPQVTAMEDQVLRSLHEGAEPEDAPRLSEVLNGIQQDLEILQANVTYSGYHGGD